MFKSFARLVRYVCVSYASYFIGTRTLCKCVCKLLEKVNLDCLKTFADNEGMYADLLSDISEIYDTTVFLIAHSHISFLCRTHADTDESYIPACLYYVDKTYNFDRIRYLLNAGT